MRKTVTQKLSVELAFPAGEKHPTGQAKAVFELKAEAERLGIDLDFDQVWSSGPTRVAGSNWDGKHPKESYDHQVFTAWGHVVTRD